MLMIIKAEVLLISLYYCLRLFVNYLLLFEAFCQLFLIRQHKSFFSDRPAAFFVDKKSVERVGRLTVLLNPGFAPVVGAQDAAARADYPAEFVVREINSQQRFLNGRLDFYPI